MDRPGQLEIARSFDDVVLPHLNAGYRLARWLTGNEHDAEDVVQEASLRALRYFRTFVGGDGRAWFLSIVRNTSRRRQAQRPRVETDSFDEERHSDTHTSGDPEAWVIHNDDASVVAEAMNNLPDRLRVLLQLREFEGLTYRELADALSIPIGTVMSGLSRARQALRGALDSQLKPHGDPERIRHDTAAGAPTALRRGTRGPAKAHAGRRHRDASASDQQGRSRTDVGLAARHLVEV
jgi:RNA polymerase sigma-70 factor, ECF subfamily